MRTQKVWFVTVASRGLGATLVKKLLLKGYCVAATSRSVAQMVSNIPSSENFLPLATDLSNEESVAAAIAATIKKFGRIDVVVINAGYGQISTPEEVSDREVRENFDVNVFGLLNV